MGQKLGLAQTGCLPPQMAKTLSNTELDELREVFNIILQYRANTISREQLGQHFPGLLAEDFIAGEQYNIKKLDAFLKDLTFEKFVATINSHYSDASAGAFVAETLAEDRKVDIDANDIDLVSIFKYYDNDDNGTVDLLEVRNALTDLHRISMRAFEGYPAWMEEDLSETIIADHIRAFAAEAPEGKEIRLDFAEFSTLTMEFVRFSTLSMIELKHREKHSESLDAVD